MVVKGSERMVMIDCVSNPILRLEKAGLENDDLTDLVLTHFHPDHVSGVPLLLMDMWLMGRKRLLKIYGLQHTIDRIEEMMGLFGWSEWPNFYPVEFIRLPAKEMTTVLDCSDFQVFASPVHHFLPTIGLRFEFTKNHKTMAYSGDTEPCTEVVRLAEGVDILIHEAAGPGNGHTSPEQAGEIASKAEVGKLYLIHYPSGKFVKGDIVAAARKTYQGPVSQAEDFMVLDFD